MNPRASFDVAASPIEVLSRGLPPDASIRQIRGMLLAGYGKGASEATINAVTRDRGAIGGIATEVRREQLAQQTAVARTGSTDLLSRLARGVRNLVVIGVGSVLVLGLVSVLSRGEQKLEPKKCFRL